jgi:hypothetical protein
LGPIRYADRVHGLLAHLWQAAGATGPEFFLVPSRALQLRAATRGDLAFPRRFAVNLASGALFGVGRGGGLDESTEDLYIPVLIRLRLNKLGLGFLIPTMRMGSSSWAASPAHDGVGVRRTAPTSTAASPTSLAATASVKSTSSPDLEYWYLLWIWSGSPFVPSLPSPALALARLAPPVKILRSWEVCLPTRCETGLVLAYHQFWWFHSPSGCALVR